jgi:5-methylcytosine-specific restriction protein A
MPQRAKQMPRKLKPRHRKSARERGYSTQWDAFARHWLAVHPLCAECQRHGRLTPAECVDHIQPHRGDMEVFWRAGNHQSLCRACHTAKTRRGG